MPQLPLDTVLRCRLKQQTQNSLPDLPIVITERKRVGWCNQAASDAGIYSGMSETNAHALAANLQAYPREPHLERRALHEAALWTLHFTPHVTLRDSGLLAEVAASLRLFNGRDQLASLLLAGLSELGLHARLASAPTATGAWLLAQCDDASDDADASLAALLDPVPLTVVDAAQKHLDTLTGIGCATLGQLRRLPRSGLTRRFGNALLRELDRAYGEEAEAHDWFEAPAAFDARLELPARVENTEALLFAARRLLLQLAGWLTARHAAVAGITLWLHHEPARRRGHRSTPVAIKLASSSRDADHLSVLLRERLSQLELIAPVIELSLAADQIAALAAPNVELFPTPASEAESVGRLIERLQSRLGVNAVRQLSIFPDHRPEKSYATTPIANRRQRAQKKMSSQNPPARPAWLLPQPLALATRQHKPFYQSPLTLLAGPERIESGWWDDALAARDYFIAENDRHALLWIFRVRTTGGPAESGWFLHGIFG